MYNSIVWWGILDTGLPLLYITFLVWGCLVCKQKLLPGEYCQNTAGVVSIVRCRGVLSPCLLADGAHLAAVSIILLLEIRRGKDPRSQNRPSKTRWGATLAWEQTRPCLSPLSLLSRWLDTSWSPNQWHYKHQTLFCCLSWPFPNITLALSHLRGTTFLDKVL